jgi:hypothetical protein
MIYPDGTQVQPAICTMSRSRIISGKRPPYPPHAKKVIPFASFSVPVFDAVSITTNTHSHLGGKGNWLLIFDSFSGLLPLLHRKVAALIAVPRRCSKCDMSMIVAGGYGLGQERKTFECLQCSHVEKAITNNRSRTAE